MHLIDLTKDLPFQLVRRRSHARVMIRGRTGAFGAAEPGGCARSFGCHWTTSSFRGVERASFLAAAASGLCRSSRIVAIGLAFVSRHSFYSRPGFEVVWPRRRRVFSAFRQELSRCRSPGEKKSSLWCCAQMHA